MKAALAILVLLGVAIGGVGISLSHRKPTEVKTPITPQQIHFMMEGGETAIAKVTTREEIDAVGRWYLAVVRPPQEAYIDVLLTNGKAVRIPRTRTVNVTVMAD